MNIVDPILFQARRQPPVAAICVPGPGIGLISYRRLETFIHNISRRLHALGLTPRSVVAVKIEDVIFHAAVVLALTRLGMVTLSLRENEMAVPIKIGALITTRHMPVANMGRVLLADLSWSEGDGTPLPPHLLPQTAADDLCRIILTSGTTNTPKAVGISHRLMADRIHRHLLVFGNRLGNCHRVYSDVPISSSLGFQFLVYALWRGGTAFFPGPDFAGTLRMFEEYKVQCVVGSPGALENMLRWFDTIPSYQSNIEMVFCGGDLLSPSLSERVRSRICSHLLAAYGSTEASMSATAHAHEIIGAPRAVGFATPGVAIQIVDEAGVILPPDQEGIVRIRSEFAVDHYLDSPEESAKSFRDGWFFPGDIGTLSSEGLLAIHGRAHSVLNVGGDKISPETLEAALMKFRGIKEAVATTAPNEYGNNEICVMVVSGEPPNEKALRAHCQALLPLPFVPARYYFVDDLPHNEMGKIDRRRAQEQLNRMLGTHP